MASHPSARDARSRAGRTSGRGSGPASASRAGARPSSRPGARNASRSTAPPPAAAAETRSRFTGRAAVLVLVVAVLVVSYASSMRAYLRQQHHINALQTNIHHAKSRIAALQRENERWQDPHFVEARARARFGWVMPGEIGFQVIGKNGKLLDNPDSLPSDAKPGARTQQATWYQSAWGSVVAAGNPPKENAGHHPAPLKKIRLH